MATIITRETGATAKGSPLTNLELDNNFINLNTELGQKLPLAGGTMTGAITFAAGQTWPTFNQNTTGSAATLTTGRTIGMTGDVTWTSAAFNGSGNVTGTATLANSGVTAGTYGNATNIPQLTVDAKGRITGVTNTAVSIPSGSLTFTGDVTGTGTTGASTALTLANSGVTAGAYGSASAIPIITVDAKGRVTALSTAALDLSTKLNLSGGTMTGAITFAAGQTWPTFNQNTTGSAASVVGTVTGTNATNLVYGNMADNDQFRILVGGTASNSGYAEIATADDGNEPIYVRQYTGVFTTLARTATLLDGSGNTSFPGTVTAAGFSGNASTATTLQTARTLTIGSTGKTFNGSADVSWSLAEIGAAASSHTHAYLPSSGAITLDNTLTMSNVYTNSGTSASINVARGAGADPYGTVAVTRDTSSNYSYYGLTRSGQIGIGMGINTSNQFWIGGSTAGADGVLSGTAWMLLNSAGLTAAGNVTAYSDERLKTNWRALPVNFIDELAKVKSGVYDRIDQDLTQVGVSAQSLQTILPDAITEQEEGILSVVYGNAAMVSVVELAKRLIALEEEVRILRGEK